MEKYLATAMKRYKLKENYYLYVSSHYIIGNYNEQTNVFEDENGNNYLNILDSNSFFKNMGLFFNIILLKDLNSVVEENLTLKEKLDKFEDLAKSSMILSLNDGTDSKRLVTINLEKLIDMEDSGYFDEEEEYEEDNENMSPEIEDLILDIVCDKYDIEELKEIKRSLTKVYNDIESAIDTIDLKVEGPLLEEETTQELKKLSLVTDDGTKKVYSCKDIDIDDVFLKVTESLICQDEAARRLIVEMVRKEMNPIKKKEGILLVGATGVGKTKLATLVSKYFERPFKKINATSLTVPGYIGRDIEEELWDLYESCGYDLEKTEQAIIFFDEIDKKSSNKNSDISGKGVLNLLLPFIEGSVYEATDNMHSKKRTVKIDTSNMIVLLAGAYTDVLNNLVENGKVGFNGSVGKIKREATAKDFAKKGLVPDELVGRISIIKLKDFYAEEIKKVMLEGSDSAIKIQEKIFAELGVKLTFTDAYSYLIAKRAEERGTGARGLNAIIDESTWCAFDEIYKKANRGIYSEVILTDKTVSDPSNFQLVKK